MLHASTQKLIHKLCALTESGDIAWREGEGDTLVFDTEGYRVEVHADPPLVRLLRTDGKELETASASDLASTPWPDGQGTFASHISEMTRQALRAARGADVAISKILSSLSAPPQKTAEPPPSPHTVPEPPTQPPRAETAVGKLFAAHQPDGAIESPAVEPEAEAPVEAAEEELPLEDAPAETPRPPLPEPQFRVPVFAAPPGPQRHAAVRGGFGSTSSFAIAPWIAPRPEPVQIPPLAAVRPEPPQTDDAEPPIAPKVTSTGLFINGVGSKARQTVREEQELERSNPTPAPDAQTPPAPEPRRKPAPVGGSDIYKPWT